MRVRAKTSFAGEVSMALNEVRDVPEGDVLDDLIRCGYVVPEGAEKNENIDAGFVKRKRVSKD